MTFTHIHPGGYLWRVDRCDRDARVLQLATDSQKLIVITRTDVAAMDWSERLTLSGLPAAAATTTASELALATYASHNVTALVITDDALQVHGPIEASVVVHAQVAPSAKCYQRRVATATAPVHVTLVVPEDEDAVQAMIPTIAEGDVVDLDEAVAVDSMIDLTGRADVLATSGKRRFPLVR